MNNVTQNDNINLLVFVEFICFSKPLPHPENPYITPFINRQQNISVISVAMYGRTELSFKFVNLSSFVVQKYLLFDEKHSVFSLFATRMREPTSELISQTEYFAPGYHIGLFVFPFFIFSVLFSFNSLVPGTYYPFTGFGF